MELSRLRYRLGLLLVATFAPLAMAAGPPGEIARFFEPPPELRDDLGGYRSPLLFDDGRPVRTADDWRARRGEILRAWNSAMGTWPPAEDSRIEGIGSARRDGYNERRVRLK